MNTTRLATLLIPLAFALACQTPGRTRSNEPSRETPSVSGSQEVPEVTGSPDHEVTPPAMPTVPTAGPRARIGLILGPGALRAYAHAGLIQEVAKARIPIYWIGGLEMGALPASLYAMKAQPFEAEWQMMKLKEEDVLRKGILSGSSALKIDTLAEPLKLMFGGARAEDAKVSSGCASYSVAKKQTLMLSKGAFAQYLLYCLPMAPLYQNLQGNGANPMALIQLSQTARQKGAQLLIYVDLLSDNAVGSDENGYLWGLVQQSLESQSRFVNEVVRVGGLAGLRSFDQRREMVQKGQEAGRRLVQLLQTKYGY